MVYLGKNGVRAALAKMHKYDSRIYQIDTATPDEIAIVVGRGRDQVGPLIKEYNSPTNS
jgi:hypothetical protein